MNVMKLIVPLGLLCLTSLGCGGGSEFPLAKAEGICLCEGQPVDGGRIIFQPVKEGKGNEVGKPAMADIGPDGTFVLTTNKEADGAVVGKHTVQVVGRYVEDDEDKLAVAAAKLPCESPQNLIVEVKSGEKNSFEIKMGPKKATQLAGSVDK